MEVVLNIGLARTGKPNLNTLDVLRAAANHGIGVYSTEVFQSDTEPTLVVKARHSGLGFDNTVDMLSAALNQDCIGVWYTADQFGQLIGPRADAWGEFNPEFFIMPDGTRLASPAAKAA